MDKKSKGIDLFEEQDLLAFNPYAQGIREASKLIYSRLLNDRCNSTTAAGRYILSFRSSLDPVNYTRKMFSAIDEARILEMIVTYLNFTKFELSGRCFEIVISKIVDNADPQKMINNIWLLPDSPLFFGEINDIQVATQNLSHSAVGRATLPSIPSAKKPR